MATDVLSNGNEMSNNDEVSVNRSEQCFLSMEGIKGPVTSIVPGAFAVLRYFINFSRDVQVAETGLLQPGGTLTSYYFSAVIPTPSTLPTLQQDCFSGKLLKKVEIVNYANINANNKEISKITLGNARLSLVTSNFDPDNMGSSMSSNDVFGATSDREANKRIFLDVSQRFPNTSAIPHVLLKYAFETFDLTVNHFHDGGDASGKSAVLVDLNKNTSKASG
jgi:hypothetical protein